MSQLLEQTEGTKLLTAQDEFIFSKAKFPAIVGTWGCGKSLAGLYAANLECENNPGNLYLIIRKEFVDLRDSTMQDWIQQIGRPWDGNKNVNYDNGSVLMFRHGSDIDSLKNTNLGGALFIQAEEMSETEFWFVCGRLRRKQGTLQLRLESNYNGHNWIYKLWKKKDLTAPLGSTITANDFHLVETCTLDNKENLPEAYIASLEMLPDKLKRRHYLGSWDEAEGLVYDEFSENKHVMEPFIIPDEWEKGFVLDHGFRNPTAVLWYAIDYDGNIYLYNEHYQTEKGISHHAQAIKAKGITTGWADPSIFSKTQNRLGSGDIFSIADEYRDAGITLIAALKEEEKGRIARVNEFFKFGRIRVFNTLQNFLQEINNWKWTQPKGKQEELNLPETPEDKDNHLMDDLGYLIASRFQATAKPEKVIQEGTVAHILKMRQEAAKAQHQYSGMRYRA